jgi:hypothetical protein
MNVPDFIFESLKSIFESKILKFFDADLDLGSGIFLTLDPGSRMERFGSEIRDKHHVSATLARKTPNFQYIMALCR